MCFVLEALISTTEDLRGELYKSEALLTASALLVVKAKYRYILEHNQITHKMVKIDFS